MPISMMKKTLTKWHLEPVVQQKPRWLNEIAESGEVVNVVLARLAEVVCPSFCKVKRRKMTMPWTAGWV
jgi:hypothetical protein